MLDRARPVVDSVQHPWNAQLSIVYLIAGPVCVGAEDDIDVDETELVTVTVPVPDVEVSAIELVVVDGGEIGVKLAVPVLEDETEVEVVGAVALESALLAS